MKKDFLKDLDELGLTHVDAAKLLSVNVRTVRRWAKNPDKIPGATEKVVQAWLRLYRIGMSWRPDGLDVIGTDYSQIDEPHAKEIRKLVQEAMKKENKDFNKTHV